MPPEVQFFCSLLLILFCSRAFGEVAVRLGQPQLVGELIAGVGLGAMIGARPDLLPHLVNVSESESFGIIFELAAFFVMVMAGLELDPSELANDSAKSAFVAGAGVIVPLAAGVLLSWIFLPPSELWLVQAILLGVVLSITDVPASLWVLMSLGKLHTPTGRLIVSAAIFDDIFGLILLAILTAIIATGSALAGFEVVYLLARIVLFFVLALATGHFLLPMARRLLHGLKETEHEFSFLIIAALAYGLLAELLQLHLILGGFFAGLFFTHRTDDDLVYADVQSKMSGITSGFFAPLFFASIGLNLDLRAVSGAPLFLASMLTVAFLSKIIGCGGAARLTGSRPSDALSIGIAMCARGAVALVVAQIARDRGIFAATTSENPQADYLYSMIVLTAIITTILSPILLRIAAKRIDNATPSNVETP